MGYFKVAQICLNGHVISDNINDNSELGQKFCQECGAETITKCLNCNTPIRGEYRVEGIVCIGTEKEPAPLYCFNCGQPFPWTEDALESARIAIDEANELNEDDRAKLKQSLPDLMRTTPRTSLAVSRVKKAFLVVGDAAKGALMDFVVQHCCEVVKSQLGL